MLRIVKKSPPEISERDARKAAAEFEKEADAPRGRTPA
jgi:hypothetical protein